MCFSPSYDCIKVSFLYIIQKSTKTVSDTWISHLWILTYWISFFNKTDLLCCNANQAGTYFIKTTQTVDYIEDHVSKYVPLTKSYSNEYKKWINIVGPLWAPTDQWLIYQQISHALELK